MDRATALIAVMPDGYVRGVSYSPDQDAELLAEAVEAGAEVRGVAQDYASRVIGTHISLTEKSPLPSIGGMICGTNQPR